MSQMTTSRYVWQTLPWKRIEVKVFKLQRRIYQASVRGNHRLVHKLQRLLRRSWYAKLLAIRRVCQDNQGKRTAGIDGVKNLSPEQRLALAQRLDRPPTVSPLRRVWIDKPGKAEQRPLGIPTIADRALQALIKQVLEPEWEAKFEPNSYGFRPGRSAHDAIGAIFDAIRSKPKYVLDADIAQCFERIDHSALLQKLQAPPSLRRLIRDWLQAGVLDHGQWNERTSGTPQGGVLSPLLANIALHGMETHLQTQFPTRWITRDGKRVTLPTPRLIRYADDLVVLHEDLQVIRAVQLSLEAWLAPLGLQLHPDKTRWAHTLDGTSQGVATGFDFLGFHIQQYRVGRYHSGKTSQGTLLGFKTWIRPSATSVQTHWQQIRQILKSHRRAPQASLIRQLNPIIRGWTQYFRTVVSYDTFSALDNHLNLRLLRWERLARPRHMKARTHVARCWGIDSGQGWVFRTPQGLTLRRHTDTPLLRHIKISGSRSPFDGDWGYWSRRQGRYPGVPPTVSALIQHQRGKCAHCGLYFTSESLVDIHHRDGNHLNRQWDNLQLLHRHCHDQVHGAGTTPTTGIDDNNSMLEEPCAVKVASTVLQPSGGSDSLA